MTIKMTKPPKLLATLATFLLTACGPATYDIDNPKESTEKMLEELTQDEKVQFGKALQKITLRRLQEKKLKLIELIQLSKDPEKVKEILQCLDGKTVEEILELAK